MVIPIMNKKDPVNTTSGNPDPNKNPNRNVGNIDNINVNRDDDPLTSDDIRQVNAVDKIFKVSEALERRFENKFNRNQPISFGEKLGMKIEEKVSDTFIDKMLGGMFTTGGSTAKPEGWLAVVKTILDSGFAHQAGSRLPETIEALSKTIGPQKTDQLADAVVQAVNPKKSASTNAEDEQRKMEEYVLSLRPVNIVDIKKFMDLVNANPANTKVTDINIARDILVEEQNRIRKESKLLSPGQQYVEENPDIDRGQRFPSSQPPGIGQRDNFMDNMMGTTPMGGSSNQMTSEQILSIDPNSNESITAYAWSQGHGQLLQEPNGLNKVKNMLMRHQDDLMKQATGIGGSVGQQQQQPMIEDQGIEPQIDTNGSYSDNKWNEKDIGKVNKAARMNKEGEILVPNTADSPEAQNSIMELLQKMAVNFDNGINDMNNKLQVMEDRINKIESQKSQESQESETIVPDIVPEVTTDTVVLDTDDQLEKEQKIDDVQGDQKIEDNVQKDTKWWKNKKDDAEEVEDKKNIDSHIGTSTSKYMKEQPKNELSKETIFPKGSMGWLREQKKKKANKDM